MVLLADCSLLSSDGCKGKLRSAKPVPCRFHDAAASGGARSRILRWEECDTSVRFYGNSVVSNVRNHGHISGRYTSRAARRPSSGESKSRRITQPTVPLLLTRAATRKLGFARHTRLGETERTLGARALSIGGGDEGRAKAAAAQGKRDFLHDRRAV